MHHPGAQFTLASVDAVTVCLTVPGRCFPQASSTLALAANVDRGVLLRELMSSSAQSGDRVPMAGLLRGRRRDVIGVDTPLVPAGVVKITVRLIMSPDVRDSVSSVGAVADLEAAVFLAPLEPDPAVALTISYPLLVEALPEARCFSRDWYRHRGEFDIPSPLWQERRIMDVFAHYPVLAHSSHITPASQVTAAPACVRTRANADTCTSGSRPNGN
jgi:hypothetical protein